MRRHSCPLLVLLLLSAQPGHGQAQPPEESIRILRQPWGLHSCDSPDYDITVSPNHEVVVRSRASRPCLLRIERTTRYHLSDAEAERFRTLLLPRRPVNESSVLTCRGRTTTDAFVMLRIPELSVEWGGPERQRRFSVCVTPEDQAIVSEIERALIAIHQSLDGPPA
jgi:hypothetical protein